LHKIDGFLFGFFGETFVRSPYEGFGFLRDLAFYRMVLVFWILMSFLQINRVLRAQLKEFVVFTATSDFYIKLSKNILIKNIKKK